MKQNFMFQTQIKFLEERVSLVPGFEEKGRLYDLVVIEKTELENRLVFLKNEIENKDTLIKNSSSSDADKHRLQTAVNQQAKELDVLKKNYDEQKEYIKQLEDMLPNSKRKKLGLEVPETLKENIEEVKSTEKVSVKEDDVILKVESSGGTF